MHYKDKTFCSAKNCTEFGTCSRSLTDEVRADAQRWWGTAEAPICTFSEPEGLECYNPNKMDK
jgi:hypothetical protein